MNRSELKVDLEDALYVVQHGCSDSGCTLNPNKGGQRTNGGCKCGFTLRRKFELLAKVLKKEMIE